MSCRVRKAVKLRHIHERSNSVQSNNHYMTWGTFSKGNTNRGVKFVDYIDYYMWLSNLSGNSACIEREGKDGCVVFFLKGWCV